MLYVSGLALLNSGVMVGCYFLYDSVWAFWTLQVVLVGLLITIYTTIRAMLIDTVKPQDFSLALSQCNLISQVINVKE